MRNYICTILLVLVCFCSSCVENQKYKRARIVKARQAFIMGNKRPDYNPNVLIERDTVYVYSNDSIYLPDFSPQARKYSHWYVDGSQNEDMLYEACDFNSAYTRQFAANIAAKYSGPFCIEQACEIYRYCMSRWGYVNDPYDQEYVASASETIYANLRGDCDDFAVLVASLMMSVGGRARIVTVPGHAYAELDISSLGTKSYILEKIKQHSKDEYVSRIYTMEDHGGVWLSMDWGEGKKHIGQNYTVPSHEYDLYMYSNQGWHWTPYSK
jgi:transglutaminase-like putative cysteine protease